MQQLVVKKIENKLAFWKHKYISFARRICLINSFLSSIPIFIFLFQDAFGGLEEVCRHSQKISLGREVMKKIKRQHGLGGKMCANMRGGIGYKNLKYVNEALLGKWRWNLFHFRSALQCDVLDSKYDGWRGVFSEGHNA